jgi:hypothetical protein
MRASSGSCKSVCSVGSCTPAITLDSQDESLKEFVQKSRGNTPFLLRIISMVPGILVAAGGLISIMLAQHTKATVDTSEMTPELLKTAKGQVDTAQTVRSAPRMTSSSNSVGPKEAGDRIKAFKGREILKHTDGMSVDGHVLRNVIEAERHINVQEQPTS